MSWTPTTRRSPPGARRRGFSLIELLINLGIIAALMGIALPFYQGYTYEAEKSRALQDLDTYVNAVVRYEAGNRYFNNVHLRGLMPQYLSSVSRDPWGMGYRNDAGLGVLGTLGADNMQFGEDSEQDLVRHYKPYVSPLRVEYRGGVGIPDAENRLLIKLNKPFGMVDGIENEAPYDVVVFTGLRDIPPVPIAMLGFQWDPQATSERNGLLAFKCCASPNPNLQDPDGAGPLEPYRIPVTADSQIDFSPFVLAFTEISVYPSPWFDDPFDFLLGVRPAGNAGGGVPIDLR